MPGAGRSGVVEQNLLTEVGALMVGHPATLTAARAWVTGAATAADIFVQIYDAALLADVTIGTTVPRWVILIPDGDNISSGDGLPEDGLSFDLGIVAAATSQSGNNTAPAVDPQVRLGIS